VARQRSRGIGLTFLVLAAVAGGVHATFSLYWAVGGDWLLDTVGKGAVELQRKHRLAAAALLLAVTAVKVGGAGLPILVERAPGTWYRRVVRAASWLGGCFLVAYGCLYAGMSNAVLHGLITVPGEVDRRGMIGHAYLWDPLFALWGAALVVGLWFTRRPDRAPTGGPREDAHAAAR
jgi:hypothetical protein